MTGGDELRVAYRVAGRVQGVGFRWWTQRRARELGVRGAVRNLPDGTVWVEVAGPPAAVETLRARLAEGPRGARVTEVTEQPPSADPLPHEFEIRT